MERVTLFSGTRAECEEFRDKEFMKHSHSEYNEVGGCFYSPNTASLRSLPETIGEDAYYVVADVVSKPINVITIEELFMNKLHEEIMNLVNVFFNDMDKTAAWMITDNHSLGGISPNKMIDIGRFAELKSWVSELVDKVSKGLSAGMTK